MGFSVPDLLPQRAVGYEQMDRTLFLSEVTLIAIGVYIGLDTDFGMTFYSR